MNKYKQNFALCKSASHICLCVQFSLITTGYQAVQTLHSTISEYIRLLTRLINSSDITTTTNKQTNKQKDVHYFSSYFIKLNQTSCNQKLVLISYTIGFVPFCMAYHYLKKICPASFHETCQWLKFPLNGLQAQSRVSPAVGLLPLASGPACLGMAFPPFLVKPLYCCDSVIISLFVTTGYPTRR